MANPLTIFDLKVGESGRISGFTSQDIPMKLYELGLIPGTFITLKKRMLFGGPVCIQISNSASQIALRSTEANAILIEKLLVE